MRIYDVSLTLSNDMPVWPGDPAVQIERFQKMEEGDHANVTRLAIGAHTGTHVDAPFHFLGGSTPTVDQLALKMLVGRADVLYLPAVDLITAAVLRKAEIPPRTRRLLFKTRNSEFWKRGEKSFQTDFVALSPDGAQYLVDHGIKVVGVDYLSVAPYGDGIPTYQVLLKAGVVVIEGLNLSAVAQGRYTQYCLPLKLAGADGAPARMILIGV